MAELPCRVVQLACVYLYGNYGVQRLEEALDVAIATTEIASISHVLHASSRIMSLVGTRSAHGSSLCNPRNFKRMMRQSSVVLKPFLTQESTNEQRM
jgi:hypothetical protein